MSSHAHLSQSLLFLRTSAIRDLQRSEELSRLIFCFLFAALTIGASLIMMPQGWGRVAAWMFAAALVFDGIGGVALLARRLRVPATATMLEFIRQEHRQVEGRLWFERYSQCLMVIAAAAALLLAMFAPPPASLREGAYDALMRVAIVVAALTIAWRRAKSRSREMRRELESYLKDIEK